MELNVKIALIDDKKKTFMGIGLVWLLRRIKKFKSINEAAKDMGMSYVKALKILNVLEKNLGQKILIRKKGGSIRSQTEITLFAEKFIKDYDEYQKKVKTFADKEFLKFSRLCSRHAAGCHGLRPSKRPKHWDN
ncbi:MAG: LysR family transcriptional regulator [Elusimicrobia bacterium]|nr:LysR family transcriptional regulator [Elusimicrobiota bacterium]